jgi:hypothetical protein
MVKVYVVGNFDRDWGDLSPDAVFHTYDDAKRHIETSTDEEMRVYGEIFEFNVQ